jgi:hypothetical protein
MYIMCPLSFMLDDLHRSLVCRNTAMEAISALTPPFATGAALISLSSHSWSAEVSPNA